MSNFTHNGVVNVDQIAEMLKLSSWDSLDDANLGYYWEGSSHASDDIDKEIAALDPRFQWKEIEELQSKAEELRYACEDELRDELFRQWYAAVMYAAEKLFGYHHLQLVPLVPVTAREKTPYEYRVETSDTWEVSADQMVETINGVGMFYFSSVAEFVGSGPFDDAKEAILNHLHWIVDYPRVYGAYPAQRLYEMQIR